VSLRLARTRRFAAAWHEEIPVSLTSARDVSILRSQIVATRRQAHWISRPLCRTAPGRSAGFAENGGDLPVQAGCAEGFELTIEEAANTWARNRTMGEGFNLAVQIFARDLSKLPRCSP
jgi:hypothetical protein